MAGHFGILLLFCIIVVFADSKPQFHRLTDEKGTLSSKYQPYTVAVRYNGHYTCSGSIISPTKILTTASCVLNQYNFQKRIFEPKLRENLTVYAGSASLSSGGTVLGIERISVPSDYSNEKFAHDVAVITLSTAIKYSDKQRPIGLPNEDVINNSIGVTSGWGIKVVFSDLEDNIQNFKMNVVNADKCNFQYFGYENETVVDRNDFCGVAQKGDRGLCYGQSGSPLIQNGTVVGILSWGMAGCNNEYPDVFTNTFKHLEFIKKELE